MLAETVGLIASLQLYQSYLTIGVLADARAEGLYEAAELTQLLGSVVGPLDKVEKQLEKVAALKLTKEDAAAIARMKKIAGLLRQQGKSLQTFWDTGVADHGKKYEEARQAAWKELSDLLDLDPKKGIATEPKKLPVRSSSNQAVIAGVRIRRQDQGAVFADSCLLIPDSDSVLHVFRGASAYFVSPIRW